MSGIVVGLDDSQGGRLALRWALQEAALRQESVTVVCVVNELPVAVPAFYATDAAGHVEDTRTSTLRWANRMVDELTSGRDVPPVEVEVVAGHPAAALVERSAGATLVVVGSRGAGGFSRLLLGSVSTAVVHHAHCPVLVVPGPGERV